MMCSRQTDVGVVALVLLGFHLEAARKCTMEGKPNTIEQVWKVDYLQVSKEIHEKVIVALWRKGTH